MVTTVKWGAYIEKVLNLASAEWIVSMITIINVNIGDEDEGKGQGHCEYVISRINLTVVIKQISFNRVWVSQVK